MSATYCQAFLTLGLVDTADTPAVRSQFIKLAWGGATPLPTTEPTTRRPLYSAEERARRDQSPWTIVQGVLAPVQFLVFLVSLALVLRYLGTGEGYAVATVSIVVKTLVLYAIMVTGSIWEKVVFGRWLFAPTFFWEDVFSMLVQIGRAHV